MCLSSCPSQVKKVDTVFFVICMLLWLEEFRCLTERYSAVQKSKQKVNFAIKWYWKEGCAEVLRTEFSVLLCQIKKTNLDLRSKDGLILKRLLQEGEGMIAIGRPFCEICKCSNRGQTGLFLYREE